MRTTVTIILAVLLVAALPAAGQCTKWVLNPHTGKMDCASWKLTVTVATVSPQAVAQTGFYFNNAAGAMTFNLPAITTATVGNQYCFRNYTGRTGAITLQLPAATSVDVDGVNGTAGGTLVSGGALGDSACVVAVAVGQYMAYIGTGVWTNN